MIHLAKIRMILPQLQVLKCVLSKIASGAIKTLNHLHANAHASGIGQLLPVVLETLESQIIDIQNLAKRVKMGISCW